MKLEINNKSIFSKNAEPIFRVGIVLILILSLFNSLYGITSGLPYVYDPDEPTWVAAASGILANRDLNPHEFGHPGSTTIYLLAILYAIIYAAGLVLGKFQSPQDFRLLYHDDPTLVYLSGRLLSVAFSLAAVLLLILIARKIFNRTVGLISGLILALSPLFVHFSKFIRTDIQATFWVLLTFWFCLNILDFNRTRDYLFAGFFCGVAAATKYPAVLISVPVAVAYFFRNKNNFQAIRKLITGGLAALSGLFVCAPFLFIDYRSALEDLMNEARPVHLSYTGGGFFQNILWYFQSPLSGTFTWIGLALACVGIFLIIKKRRPGAWLAIIFVSVFMAFISNLNLRWERWIIPTLPFFAMFMAYELITSHSALREYSN